MHYPILLASAALLASCAHTPQELREAGTRSSHRLQLPPERAAGCIARNSDEYSDAFAANTRALPQGGRYEVVVRIPKSATVPTAAVFEISPAGSGSTATLWVHPQMGESALERFRAQSTKGC